MITITPDEAEDTVTLLLRLAEYAEGARDAQLLGRARRAARDYTDRAQNDRAAAAAARVAAASPPPPAAPPAVTAGRGIAVPGASAPQPTPRGTRRILVPPGIGDSVWALPKVEALVRALGGDRVELAVACWNQDAVESRALEFLRRFSFIAGVAPYVMPRVAEAPLLQPGCPVATEQGYYWYRQDGPAADLPGIDFVLIPNAPLERGIRLEAWLPHLETRWDVMDRFLWKVTEIEVATAFACETPYACLFTSSVAGNTAAGHNRGGLWSPTQWIDLADAIRARLGLQIVWIGADWDADYYQAHLADAARSRPHWQYRIGAWSVPQTLAIMQRSRLNVCYQSGLGVASQWMGAPTVSWWRAKGDSFDPNRYVSCDEEMATAWNRPREIDGSGGGGPYHGAIYGRESVEDLARICERLVNA